MKKKPEVDVFLGAPLTDPTEEKFLARIRADLEALGLRARILANLQVGRDCRQIDFVVVLVDRVIVCELKGFNGPLRGGPNGHWSQLLPDGTARKLPWNPIRQAHAQSYAFSDEIRKIATSADLPRVPGGSYFKHFETVACIYPALAAGSSIERHPYVKVLGYEDLIAMAASAGRSLPWQEDHWDDLIRGLGLYRPAETEPKEIVRQEQAAVLEDYRRRFRAGTEGASSPFVAMRCLVGDGEAPGPLPDLMGALRAGRSISLTGRSGFGKSRLARHLAEALAANRHLPIWLPAHSFEGDLDQALGRAVAPFTTHAATELLRLAGSAGSQVVLVVDGLNEVPGDLRGELLAQLGALRLRSECAVLLTAQEATDLPEALAGQEVRLLAPDEDEREALLDAYGAPDVVRASEVFSSPFELAIAVECAAGMGSVETRADLLDLYVGRQTGRAEARSVLRSLAAKMHDELRGSLPTRLVLQVLERAGDAPGVVLEALASPLVRTDQGRVSFAHEELARFLAAESIVAGAADGEGLRRRLVDPRAIDVARDVLAIETDSVRLLAALPAISDAAILRDALAGELGETFEEVVGRFLDDLLDRAIEASAHGEVAYEMVGEEPGMLDRWLGSWSWTPLELTGFALIGEGLHRGLRVDRVIELALATDRLCARQVERLRAEGHRGVLDWVVSATYCFGSQDAATGLPVSVIARACEHTRFMRHKPPASEKAGSAARFLDAAGPDSWGVYYLMAAAFDADTADREELPRALRAAWDARGYHLRLQVFRMAEFSAMSVEGELREQTVEILEGLDSGNLLLNSMWVEALAAYDLVDSGKGVAEVEAEIRGILGEDSPHAPELARGCLSSQFENESIVGPYYAVISRLPDSERAQLLRLGLEASEGHEIGTELFLRELAGCGDLDRTEVQAVFEAFAQPHEEGEWARWNQMHVRSFVEALDACARFCTGPPFEHEGSIFRRTWAAVGELIFWSRSAAYGRESSTARVEELWASLEGELRPAVADVFRSLRHSDSAVAPGSFSPHGELLTDRPAELRRIFGWSLGHRRELIASCSSSPRCSSGPP
ncbi:MAG TPA: NERD domain-containing protein [Solirubrobacterales bacterium]|jgi:hypothetical protein|nr:NERD domain-containing protein [Solirubrobacterales bacterium]